MDSLKVSDEKKKYITEVLNPVLEAMVTDCLAEMPEETSVWILSWLKKKQGGDANTAAGGGGGDLAKENEELSKQVRRMSSLMDEAAKTLTNLAGKDEKEEEEEEEEDEDDELDEIPEVPAAKKGARASVSAEAYGAWNQKVEFTPPVIAKSEEQKKRLGETLSKSFLFSALDGKDLSQVIDAMEEKGAEEGETLINQGDDGDFLFVVEEGALDCKRKEDPDKVLKTCEAGDVFGELALLYNCPRAANVVAKQKCVLWKLDRNTFNAIVKDAAAKKRERYESFLQKVPLLSGLDAYEKSQVADAFKSEKYKDGEEIVKENEDGDKFYVVEDGACVAEKAGDKMMDYKPGDYFGELALLRNQPRAATVKATGDVSVLSLDRRTFKRLLGGLEDILNAKMTAYGGAN